MPDDAKPRRKPPNRDGSRPHHHPSPQLRRIVERMVTVLGASHDQVGRVLGVSDVTLRKHYRNELDRAGIAVGLAIGQTYIQKMLGGTIEEPNWRLADTSALIWYMRARVWRDGAKANDNAGGGLGPDFADI